MTRQILILGGNLSGLVTAYRLIPFGFHLTILENHPDGHLPCPIDSTPTPTGLQASSTPISTEEAGIPLILHGFYHATWSFLHDLGVQWPLHTFSPIDLEFLPEGGKPVSLPRTPWLTSLHPLARFAFFKGLSWSDRWNVINFLEKKWEGELPADHNPDTQPVEAWLTSAKQSAQSLTSFWNPLSQFFLGCDVSQASLGSFLEILSRFWLGKSRDSETFLSPSATLLLLEQELKRVLLAKGVQFCRQETITHIPADTAGIQAIECGRGEPLRAQAYISTLAPQNLLPLLPERALARFSYFSSMAQLQEVSGTAIQFTLHDSLILSRLILSSWPFVWVTSQPVKEPHSSKTVITCVTFRDDALREPTDEWLRNTAWNHIQQLFTIPPTHTQESCEPRIIRKAYHCIPSQIGSRTSRPLSKSPIPNLFLAGSWTATNLPSSLESTILSANACSQAVAESFYGNSH